MTYHLPWSPGATDDNDTLRTVNNFLSKPGHNKTLVMTEKLDGVNCCLNSSGVYVRDHGDISFHPAFDYVKGLWGKIRGRLEEGEEIFGENCYAVHSIAYRSVPDYFFVFNIKRRGIWLSYDEMILRSEELGLSTTPRLFKGIVVTEKRLHSLCLLFMRQPSNFGNDREGIIIRIADEFKDQDFEKSIAKCALPEFGQSVNYWLDKRIVKQIKK